MKSFKFVYIYWKLIGLCPSNLTKYGIFRFSYGGSFVLSSRMNINSQFNISMEWVPFSFGRIVFPNFIILFFTTISAINDQFLSLNDKIQDHAKGPSMITDTKRLKRLKNHQR